MTDIFRKGLEFLLKRQTNILSAAFIIMSTVILSQVLGLVKQRLLIAIFGLSPVGVYFAASLLPDFLFQAVIGTAISSAFIPVFAHLLSNDQKKEAEDTASSLLTISLSIFIVLAIILAIFAPYILQIMNLGNGFSPDQMVLMTNLMRILLVAELFFMLGIFFTAVLQTHNHFFIPGMAAAMYNLGIIIGILALSNYGIYGPALGNILGAVLFVILQIPILIKVGFPFKINFDYKNSGFVKILHLMWPRSIANIVFNVSSILTVALISFIQAAGRNYTIFNCAQTLAFAPVTLFGQTIAQAAFPVLAREKDKLEEFKITFLTSFNQMLYLVLPASVLLLVLRIPIVRLVYGANLRFDWPATVLTGRTLALFSLCIFSESLKALIARGFYARHNTKILLFVGTFATILMLALSAFFVIFLKLGVMSVAFAYSLSSITELIILFILLDRHVQGFDKKFLLTSWTKIFGASFFTAFAIYIPIKLLDQLVFDTTKTINLLLLTGISSLIGLSIYFFLTWLFNVKEAQTYLTIIRRLGNWREVMNKQPEVIESTKF
ncbi:MAG TPA: lipid II flippase MurJ [Patescibacteria group bacterium]|nr:lipid II flippase MurJ [Patescibacteria group bacterium]